MEVANVIFNKKVEKIVIAIGALSIAFVLSLILVYNTLISTDWYEQVITSRVPYVIYIVIVFILILLYLNTSISNF